MISALRRIENDMARFQAANHLPSVRDAEEFAAHLLNLAKGRDMIAARNSRR